MPLSDHYSTNISRFGYQIAYNVGSGITMVIPGESGPRSKMSAESTSLGSTKRPAALRFGSTALILVRQRRRQHVEQCRSPGIRQAVEQCRAIPHLKGAQHLA